MCDDLIISIAVPPFPIFIEGNFTEFDIGTWHPDRKNLEYFDIIIVKEGALYLGEEGTEYAVRKNEMLVLLPNKHHYPLKPTDEITKFYWIHFYTTGNYEQSNQARQLESNIPIPSLHFHNKFHTIHLSKKGKLVDADDIYQKIQDMLVNTTKKDTNITFWDIQQRFFSLLNLLDGQNHAKDMSVVIAEKVEQFIRGNFDKEITNDTLVAKFNLHENTLAKYLKQYYGYTPMEYLKEYRLERAKNLLLKTDFPIQKIAELCGYNWVPYFSRLFKQKYDISPLQYRKNHIGNH
ncbi:AraC family transcriptional regulator [Paenibacillus sp. MBLB2552]|uniref:AraC family transcriptional regulator n=1 Tax=Paenibacillus mellifer TaxID=2937794 RepID=A0A9X1Y1F6_9BACL|nr:AraC family transcriptional regulator [Paenibacillus mellifer]MCK8488731.1 AraC family transcriptional regulator [Paenibacillus mellifer]